MVGRGPRPSTATAMMAAAVVRAASAASAQHQGATPWPSARRARAMRREHPAADPPRRRPAPTLAPRSSLRRGHASNRPARREGARPTSAQLSFSGTSTGRRWISPRAADDGRGARGGVAVRSASADTGRCRGPRLPRLASSTRGTRLGYEGSGGGAGGGRTPLMALWSGAGGPGPAAGFDVPPDKAQPLWVDVAAYRRRPAGREGTPPRSSSRSTLPRRGGRKSGPVGKAGAARPRNRQRHGTAHLRVYARRAAWSGSWVDSTFAPYYGEGTWDGSPAMREAWYDMALSYRTPPDAIYLNCPPGRGRL